jgi:hypothetical protein
MGPQLRISDWNIKHLSRPKYFPANLMKPLQLKSCSSCGQGFPCGPENDEERCWCDRLPHVSFVASEFQDCLCPKCLNEAIQKSDCNRNAIGKCVNTARKGAIDLQPLLEGEDYYLEGKSVVFTARFHLRRGYCCENRCRNCPYR